MNFNRITQIGLLISLFALLAILVMVALSMLIPKIIVWVFVGGAVLAVLGAIKEGRDKRM